MKIKKVLSLLLLFVMLIALMSCTKSPKEKIVGEWDATIIEVEDSKTKTSHAVFTITSDGKFIDDRMPDRGLKWKIMGEEKPFSLDVYIVENSEEKLFDPDPMELFFNSKDEVTLLKDYKADNYSIKVFLKRKD